MKYYHWIMLLLAAALVAVSIRLAQQSSASDTTADPSEAAIECIMTRSSVRSYSDREVNDSTLDTILRAGMASPTAANQQPWEFVVVREQALKDSIAANFKFAKPVQGCSVAIVVCGNMDNLFKDDKQEGGFWVQDCSAASENILLAAHALGLGAVWCGIYPMEDRERKMSEILSLPANFRPLNVIAIGYPETPGTPKQKWDPAKVHYGAFK